MNIKAGDKFYYYMGGVYEVICCAQNSETDEELVVYRSVDDPAVLATPIEVFDNVIPMGCGFLRRFEPM